MARCRSWLEDNTEILETTPAAVNFGLGFLLSSQHGEERHMGAWRRHRGVGGAENEQRRWVVGWMMK
ncbi:hypothetical protein M0R45_019190 [Rubus argutus]|uniref:Uncharacterized protein n=1 Tax=Rubus argutus TaxID=59490 RepID=A0AAW1X4P8_RUBAR